MNKKLFLLWTLGDAGYAVEYANRIWSGTFVAMGFAIQPGQKGVAVVEMVSYEDDGTVGMLVGKKSGEGW